MDVRRKLLEAFGDAVKKDQEINGADAVDVIADMVTTLLAEERKRKRRKPRVFQSYSLLALNEADRLAQAVIDGDPEAATIAATLQARLKEMKRETQTHKRLIEQARDIHTNDEVEIDDKPILSVADEGVWVNSWVWVTRK